MSNNKDGFTAGQNRALVNKALSVSNGKDGTFVIQGIFDKKGTPKKEDIQKTYDSFEKAIQQKIDNNKHNP